MIWKVKEIPVGGHSKRNNSNCKGVKESAKNNKYLPKTGRKKTSGKSGRNRKSGLNVRHTKPRYAKSRHTKPGYTKPEHTKPDANSLIAGRLQGNERGYGFVIPEDEKTGDIFIPGDAMVGAMHNDKVVARLTICRKEGRHTTGEIVKILERANKSIVGTLEMEEHLAFVTPDDRRISGVIIIDTDETGKARHGSKVVAEIVKWPEKGRGAIAKITEVIGDSNDPQTGVLAIMRAYKLPDSFPADVERQIADISDVVKKEMLVGRQDLREMRIVTIDGEDAKDLDDGISITALPDGGYRLGVHIADVSSYVPEGSPLDLEAFKRATSIYLADRVVPMLPAKLSNEVCSLNPNVDRLAFTVTIDFNKNGAVLNYEIFESIINTSERMTYTDVCKLLERTDDKLLRRYGHLLDEFDMMKELALILYKKRIDRGALDFNFSETKIVFNEQGWPVEIGKSNISIANRIIEEFMLACNEIVAETFFKREIPFLYRVHAEPDGEKLTAFAKFSTNMGYPLRGGKKVDSAALQDILNRVKGTGEERIVSTALLRSLAKAEYHPQNLGHFGLAAEFYCHFTAPIRRYPDLLIHRFIKRKLKGGFAGKWGKGIIQKMPEIARHCSEKEREAEEVSREAEELMKVWFMKEHVGETYEGVVSGVTSFGMFVELGNTVEGMVRFASLDNDYYIYDEMRCCLTGERTGKSYRPGDSVRVRLIRADVASRQLEFSVEEKIAEKKPSRKKPGNKEAGKKGAGKKEAGKKQTGKRRQRKT